MSPPPPAPSPGGPEEYQAIVKDSLISSVLGGGAMVSRMLLSTDPVSFGWIVRRTLAAAIVAVFAGFALQEHISSLVMRFACIGLAGAAAPEVMDGAIKWVKAKLNSEVEKVTKTTKGATNGKTKRKRK